MMQQFNRKGSIGLTATDVGGSFDARRDLVYCQRPLVCLDTRHPDTHILRTCVFERAFVRRPTNTKLSASTWFSLDNSRPHHQRLARTWRRENYVKSAPKNEPGGNRDSLELMRRDETKE
jgi:hypothetical protein